MEDQEKLFKYIDKGIFPLLDSKIYSKDELKEYIDKFGIDLIILSIRLLNQDMEDWKKGKDKYIHNLIGNLLIIIDIYKINQI